MNVADPHFPVGQARLEALGVLGCASIMAVASFEVRTGWLVGWLVGVTFVGLATGEVHPSLRLLAPSKPPSPHPNQPTPPPCPSSPLSKVVAESAEAVYQGVFQGLLPELNLGPVMYIVLGGATLAKLVGVDGDLGGSPVPKMVDGRVLA